MNPAVEGFCDFRIDLPAEAGQATERRLDVAAGTAEAVVQIEMPKRGIEIVEPHQEDHAAAEPDAFRVSGRPADGLRRLDKLISFALVVLGGLGRLRRVCRPGLAGLVLGVGIAALGEGTSDTDQQCKPRNGEVAQDRTLKLKHPLTHKVPDLLPARAADPDALV